MSFENNLYLLCRCFASIVQSNQHLFAQENAETLDTHYTRLLNLCDEIVVNWTMLVYVIANSFMLFGNK